MSEKTHISWTDATWNTISGCTRVSEGCRNCYSERLTATRLKHHPKYAGLAVIGCDGRPHWTNKIRMHPEMLGQPLRWKKEKRIFVNSMSDTFHEDVPREFIDLIFATMAMAGRHLFQVLTKRPERIAEYMRTARGRIVRAIIDHANPYEGYDTLADDIARSCWPLPNVWLGTSCENQEAADERIPHLLNFQAAVRFVSAEPLLGPLDLSKWLGKDKDKISWVIIGGESGANARPFRMEWASDIICQCNEAAVPVFMKQVGSNAIGLCMHKYRTQNKSGADIAEWPKLFQVQEFPA